MMSRGQTASWKIQHSFSKPVLRNQLLGHCPPKLPLRKAENVSRGLSKQFLLSRFHKVQCQTPTSPFVKRISRDNETEGNFFSHTFQSLFIKLLFSRRLYQYKEVCEHTSTFPFSDFYNKKKSLLTGIKKMKCLGFTYCNVCPKFSLLLRYFHFISFSQDMELYPHFGELLNCIS